MNRRQREEQRQDVIKITTMMMLMVITTLYANRFGTIQMQIGGALRGMEDVIAGFLPGDEGAARQVRANLSMALEEIARGAGESVPSPLVI
jgi:hypothetical protein